MKIEKFEQSRIPVFQSSIEVLEKQHDKIKSIPFYEGIINAIPQFAAVVNCNREIVHANKSLLEVTGAKQVFAILGRLPGDVLNCVNICEKERLCGSTEACQYCGAVQAIVESMETRKRVEKECRITSRNEKGIYSHDFLITASPIDVDDEKFTIVSLADISGTKRREALERIFFHDILNTMNGLNGYIEILKRLAHSEEVKILVDDLAVLSVSLLDDVNAQRDLLAAERGDLQINNNYITTVGIVDYCVNHVKHIGIAELKTIVKDKNMVNVPFVTDDVILKRVIINMLKNALEASNEGEAVEITSRKSEDSIEFAVKNSSVIPESVQRQIFQRSFSTKGNNRGLGTYSMKILTENYLKGKIEFSSNEAVGTCFYVILPFAES